VIIKLHRTVSFRSNMFSSVGISFKQPCPCAYITFEYQLESTTDYYLNIKEYICTEIFLQNIKLRSRTIRNLDKHRWLFTLKFLRWRTIINWILIF